MKKSILLLLFIPLVSNSQTLKHIKEIGLYQKNKNTEFIKDNDILSPKSADFINNHLLINALEKGATIIYDTNTWKKETIVNHSFKKPTFETIKNFPYKINNADFFGKPVEMIANNDKIWIPYYRLSWDQNSQNSSAIAQLNSKTFQIEKIIPAGSIPKMIKLSHDNKKLISTHWGDNTIGIYDMVNNNIVDYHHIVVDRKLDTSHISGDRDSNCGFCLRGTIVTNDDKYALVGRMGGGGIAVIDLINNSYLGTIFAVPSTPRHLVLSKDGKTLLISTCASGQIAKINMDLIYQNIDLLKNHRKTTLNIKDWITINAGSSVRTIALSKDEKFIFAALNSSSELAVINSQTFKIIEKYKIASFPVGLSVSDDDKYIAVTSQGKSGSGGNHVDVFLKN
jgi:DNA-binding beta-propeller fold protein YncE